MEARSCAWCSARIRATARRDAIYCGVRCRQAAHRARIDRLELEATDRPLRLAYADPPYIGNARRYYGDQATYAGEVDHDELLSRLAGYDGWALSCSSASVASIGALCVAQDLRARLAIWHRRPAPHPTARIVTAWEGVWYVPARRRVACVDELRVSDVLLGVTETGRRPTLPSSVIGMKPPAMLAWVFRLIAALPGDSLDDLYPGSGIVARAWAAYAGEPSRLAAATRDASAAAG